MSVELSLGFLYTLYPLLLCFLTWNFPLMSFLLIAIWLLFTILNVATLFAFYILQNFGFCSSRVTETHQLAELNEKKNERLRAAFGISDSYVDGSSFDPQRRAREAKPAPEPPKPYRYSRSSNKY